MDSRCFFFVSEIREDVFMVVRTVHAVIRFAINLDVLLVDLLNYCFVFFTRFSFKTYRQKNTTIITCLIHSLIDCDLKYIQTGLK